MLKGNHLYFVLPVMILATIACSGGTSVSSTNNTPALADLPAGDAAAGEALFSGNQVSAGGEQLPCHICHTSDGAGIGPSLKGISQRIPDGYETAEAFLYESIVEPDAYVREGYESHIMPAEIGRELTAQDLADLVAFLMQQ